MEVLLEILTVVQASLPGQSLLMGYLIEFTLRSAPYGLNSGSQEFPSLYK